jgi:hypothetical protein
VTPLSVNVRVGVGNGETFADRPMLFRSAAITSTSPFQGTDGKYWDDNSYFPSTSLLPAGTTSASNTIQTDQDCLAWSWAALAYRYQP